REEVDRLDLDNETCIFPTKLSKDGSKRERSLFRTRLVPFSDINHLRGVFLCGSNPNWILSDRGKLRAHPMSQESPVLSFSPFANVGNGFVYYSGRTSKFKVCQLVESPSMFYTTPWPMQRVLMKATPHKIATHRT